MSEFIKHNGIIEASGITKEKVTKGEITVVKVGGSTYQERAKVIADVATLHKSGIPLVLVHGGGAEIDDSLHSAGIVPVKIDGKRVTDARTLEIVVEVLDCINGQITDQLERLDVPCVGFTSDHGILQAEIDDPKYGLVGGVLDVDNEALKIAITMDVIPVVCPIATQKANRLQKLNVNADTAAGAVAASLLKSRLLLLTDVPGVLDENGAVVNELNTIDYALLRQRGVIGAGMIPKIDSCLPVIKAGGNALICHSSDLRAAFGTSPKGTVIK